MRYSYNSFSNSFNISNKTFKAVKKWNYNRKIMKINTILGITFTKSSQRTE